MITRPLDLEARLRPQPRNFDAWFYVNAGLLALLFMLLGSRFVLAPGLEMGFKLPQVGSAQGGAWQTTHYITVKDSGQIFGNYGLMSVAQLGAWLKSEAAKTQQPSLLVKASAGVTNARMAEIITAAHEAHFQVIWAAETPTAPSGAGS